MRFGPGVRGSYYSYFLIQDMMYMTFLARCSHIFVEYLEGWEGEKGRGQLFIIWLLDILNFWSPAAKLDLSVQWRYFNIIVECICFQ